MKAKHCLFLVFVLIFIEGNSQSLSGTTGLLNTPSAEMQKDGTFFLGVNYLDIDYTETYGKGKHNCLAYYLDITFLPFLEVNLRSTRLLSRINGRYTVDRMISLKLQAFKEKKYIPSFVIGGNDIITSSGNGNQYFGTLYCVITKHLILPDNKFGFSLGYGFNVFRNNQYNGFFGGISYNPKFYQQLTIIMEYDSKKVNIGASLLLFNHLHVFILTNDLIKVSGGIAYKIFCI
jgi:hypothetical protein